MLSEPTGSSSFPCQLPVMSCACAGEGRPVIAISPMRMMKRDVFFICFFMCFIRISLFSGEYPQI
ncbi:hypothetical protein JCM6294_1568 [Bacteroides pyogenes DSM 20611 = JCM 6294]|uniref:Uncharacterized protein n=1 Tax=Bacteroides pyogenes DSM 20611 = JCM 6294 TaxID=1121100 RepID=W4PFR1_9BACE|nr:hypothetical protein JCM6294_1568 [Bacteroides pyogenes DSM 20611 = JCM 6294]